MKNNLIKNLIVVTVIIFTVGIGGAWAQDFESKLPKCKGEYSSSWNNCYGKQKFINGSYEGEFKIQTQEGIVDLPLSDKIYINVLDSISNSDFCCK
jgi:hypothetical protein